MTALSSAAAVLCFGGESRVKLEADQVFRFCRCCGVTASTANITIANAASASVAAAMADSSQNYNDHFRETAGPVLSAVVGGAGNLNGSSTSGNPTSGIHSSSSSIKSPLSSPMGVSNHHNGTSNGHSSSSAQQAAAAHSAAANTHNNTSSI
ncbi:hypothetical protein EVAR_70667_1 [Eumeta japonica]|uniref:Uncharacterized protein n=1 Tax=Eumeta variegata TaxID=151549 RepID=A0A4C2ACZ2_EUMVA|nr:hypothetical protein EVAR_70667_1 [Eumeta japonica]